MDQGFKGDRVLGSGEGTGETKIHHRTSFFFILQLLKLHFSLMKNVNAILIFQ